MADIGHVFLTRIWLFQAIVAGPTFVLLGIFAIVNLYSTYDTTYDFVTNLCTAILAAGIIFIVLVQQQLPAAGKRLTYRFELAKSILATALWVWLMADAIWGPHDHGRSYSDRRPRIIASAISVILLLLLFYPTVVYAGYLSRPAGSEQDGGGQERVQDAAERAPLLQNESL